MKTALFPAFMLSILALNSCTILREYPRRSELTLEVKAHNAVDKPERAVDSRIVLHGSNRDVLSSFLKAFEFSLDQLGLKK